LILFFLFQFGFYFGQLDPIKSFSLVVSSVVTTLKEYLTCQFSEFFNFKKKN